MANEDVTKIITDLGTVKQARDDMRTALIAKGCNVNHDITTYADAIRSIILGWKSLDYVWDNSSGPDDTTIRNTGVIKFVASSTAYTIYANVINTINGNKILMAFPGQSGSTKEFFVICLTSSGSIVAGHASGGSTPEDCNYIGLIPSIDTSSFSCSDDTGISTYEITVSKETIIDTEYDCIYGAYAIESQSPSNLYDRAFVQYKKQKAPFLPFS